MNYTLIISIVAISISFLTLFYHIMDFYITKRPRVNVKAFDKICTVDKKRMFIMKLKNIGLYQIKGLKVNLNLEENKELINLIKSDDNHNDYLKNHHLNDLNEHLFYISHNDTRSITLFDGLFAGETNIKSFKVEIFYSKNKFIKKKEIIDVDLFYTDYEDFKN